MQQKTIVSIFCTSQLQTHETLILGTTGQRFEEEVGETYFSFVFERYERELLSVGGTIHDFLSNIDALHPHIRSHDHIIPACGTVLPCMRCTRDCTNTCLYLHVHQAKNNLKHLYGKKFQSD